MPLYVYKNIETGEEVEILQGMNDLHEYHGENGDEECWRRVFVAPNASIDTRINPFSKTDFIRNTEGKNDTMGDMWSRSEELSERRKDKGGGVDPIREKALDDFAVQRKGQEHPIRRREKLKKKLESKGLSIEV